MSRDRDGSLLVYDVQSDRGHSLNASASLVYELADGTRSVEDIAGQMQARTGLPVDTAVVVIALQELGKAGLLEGDARTARVATTVSRRRLIAQMTALAAGTAALFPVIDSISGLSRPSAEAWGTGGVGSYSSPGHHPGLSRGQTYGYYRPRL